MSGQTPQVPRRGVEREPRCAEPERPVPHQREGRLQLVQALQQEPPPRVPVQQRARAERHQRQSGRRAAMSEA